MTTWLVKAGAQARAFAKFRENSKVAVGWNSVGPFETSGEWEGFREEVKRHLPDDYSAQRVGSAAGQLWSFIKVMKPGDFVITPSAPTQEVLVGKVVGEYKFEPDFDQFLPRTRAMRWFSVLPWNSIPPNARTSFSAWQTIVRPGADFSSIINAAESPSQAETILKRVSESEARSRSEIENLSGKAQKAVREKLKQLNDRDFQRLVGAIFEADGYTVIENSAGAGSDGGIDIILSRDSLGAGERIIVQVKHQMEKVGRPKFQELLGTLKPNEFGLMVAPYGFTSTAWGYWRENRDKLLRPMEEEDLFKMLEDHYEKLSDAAKVLLPLERVLVPLSAEEEG